MKGQFVIIDLRNMDFMKDEEGKINCYDTMDEALDICAIYEFEDAWVMQLMYNHKEAPVVERSKQLCACAKPSESAYDPCCSLTCWCEMFEGA